MGDPSPGALARWNDLGRRAVSAVVLAPIVLLCIWTGGAVYDTLMILAAVGLAAEWLWLCGARVTQAPGLFVPGFVLLAGIACLAIQAQAGLELLAVGFVAFWAVTRRLLLASGILYIGLPLLALLWLRHDPRGRDDVLFLTLVVWASDIGAYLIGRLVRGPLLVPMLSPGKTWSGAVGGLLAALLVGALAPAGTAALGLLLGVSCQAGDLLESGIKRHVGVKDSGRLIPGHGGLLDRLDGLLAAAPVAALVMLGSRGGYW